MAQDPALDPPPIPQPPMGKPNEAPPEAVATDPALDEAQVDVRYWLDCLDDAERAERDWRKRAREVVGIYRNEAKASGAKKGPVGPGPVTFNILYANTEVILPAVYAQPPEPVVRSRFTKTMMPPMMPPPMPPMGGPPIPAGPATTPSMLPAGAPPAAAPPGLLDPAVSINPAAAGGNMPPPGAPIAGPPMLPPTPMMPPPPMTGPPQSDIDTAAAVMEKALEIVVDEEHSDEAVKMAIKDVLLPGRGVCRVRWRPQMETVPVMAGDGVTPLPGPDGQPTTKEVKIWETVDDEYVYWEDILLDPVRAASDTNWIAFRHLFTKQDLDREFAGSPQYEALKAAAKLDDIFKWTDESAAQDAVGGGGAMKTATKLGDKIRKAMLWEIWDRMERRIIWFCRDATGIVFRVDPDSLQLDGFYPIPVPMLAVTTTDTRIPRCYYDLYAKLAADLDETSSRISNLTKQIKVRGAYNSASREIADILTADDNKMIGVEGVDMINGGLSNHIWIMPIVDFMNALDKLHLAREAQKAAIYEIMGISDIMRGATKASETATAQRIKGSMGISRLEDLKQQAGNFVRDLLRLKGEIIAKNFDAETLSKMTGEEVTPEVMDILRSDFMRTCTIDIETDSTVTVDEQAEQQAMAQVMQSIQLVMQGTQQMLMTQILPPNQVIQLGLELLKMALHPVRYSRAVVELIDNFQQQLAIMAAMPPPPPAPIMLPPQGGPAGEAGASAGAGTPPGPPNGAGGPPMRPNGGPPSLTLV